MLKLEFGSSAVGVKHVHNFQEAVEHVKHLQDTLRSEADRPGVGLGHGYSLLLMPCLLGTEHDVDVVLFEGQLVAAFLSDNGPTRLPLCAETAAVMPSVLRNGETSCRQHSCVLPWLLETFRTYKNIYLYISSLRLHATSFYVRIGPASSHDNLYKGHLIVLLID